MTLDEKISRLAALKQKANDFANIIKLLEEHPLAQTAAGMLTLEFLNKSHSKIVNSSGLPKIKLPKIKWPKIKKPKKKDLLE